MPDSTQDRNWEICVLFATRNGSKTLPIMLEALLNIRVPKSGWKIIVVDNNSTDNSMEILNSYKFKLPLTILSETKPGKNASLNKGLTYTSGDLVVLTDDDVIPDRDWLLNFEEAAIENPGCDIFGGAISPFWPYTPPSWIEYYATRGFSYALTDPLRPTGETRPNFIWGPNMMIRRKLIQAGHRFSDDVGPKGAGSYIMGSETEFTGRLYELGHKCFFCQNIQVKHIIRREQMTRSWLMLRSYRYGRSVAYRKTSDGSLCNAIIIWGVPRSTLKALGINVCNIFINFIFLDKEGMFKSLMGAKFNLGAFYQYRLFRNKNS